MKSELEILSEEIAKHESMVKEAHDILKEVIATVMTLDKAASVRLCEIMIEFGVPISDFITARNKAIFNRISSNKYENGEDGA